MPTAFADALALVHETLQELHGQGRQLTATVEALAGLSTLTAPWEEAPAAPALEDSGAAEEFAAPALEPEAEVEVESVASFGSLLRAVEGVLPGAAAVRASAYAFPEVARTASPAPVDKAARLAEIRARALPCLRCEHLARTRTQVVFGVGDPEAELLFVGEAPGADEDRLGEPFVGAAGTLLTKMIAAMGYGRDQVYIANVLKCRPDMPPGAPGNRKPRPEEMATCLPYLEEQIAAIQPRVIVALGATAMEGLLGRTEPMNQLRGRWHEFHGTPLMVTYHPAYLLRNQALGEKRKVWEDMLLVLERLGATISEKQRGYFSRGE